MQTIHFIIQWIAQHLGWFVVAPLLASLGSFVFSVALAKRKLREHKLKLQEEAETMERELKLALADKFEQRLADVAQVGLTSSNAPEHGEVFVPQKGGGALGRTDGGMTGGQRGAFGSHSR